MKLSILIPVFNEEKTITDVLKQVAKVNLPCEKEIIVIDDGSTDGTRKRIKNCESGIKNFKIITHRRNKGKGAAVQSGMKAASGDYILIQDADLEYNPSEIPILLSPLINSSLAAPMAVYGSRFKKSITISPLYLFGNKLLTFLTNFLFGTTLTDMETGYKLLPTAFFKEIDLKAKHFDIEPEITAKLLKEGIPIIEIPISYKGRSRLAGKKLTVMDAFEAIRTLILHRFFLIE